MFESKLLQNNLPTKIFGRKIFAFDRIDSTNNLAKILAELGHQEGTVVISDIQTQGRGRHGKEWVSEGYKNLLFSIILRPKMEKDKIQLITFYLANSLASILEESYHCNISVKWPNDLILNNKKFCGILLESSFKGDDNFIIAGIGINVNQENFSPELPNATSLFLETKINKDLSDLFSDILICIDSDYEKFITDPDSAIAIWKKRNILTGREIQLLHKSEVISGMYFDIDNRGSLLIKSRSGEIQKFFSGEVSVIQENGFGKV